MTLIVSDDKNHVTRILKVLVFEIAHLDHVAHMIYSGHSQTLNVSVGSLTVH